MGHQNESFDWFRPASWWESLRNQLMEVFFPSYRPELHYMRGRGPKWREKQAPRLTDQFR